MKRIFALVCTLLMIAVCLVGCNQTGETTSTAESQAEQSDLAYVLEKGKLVVGITDFKPMDYQKDNEWIGFDADMARKFAEFLGVKEVEFAEIEWDYKATELANKNIDCVWNGMTITDEVKAAMDCSNAYCNNAQVVVVNTSVADKYQTADACKDLKFAVENGSAGMEQADAYKYTYTAVLTQADALMEVAAGTADAAIIDKLMAGAMIGKGTSYEQLTYTVDLNSEKYGIGFRKGSDLVAKINEFLEKSYTDGTTLEIAKKYGVQESIIDPKA